MYLSSIYTQEGFLERGTVDDSSGHFHPEHTRLYFEAHIFTSTYADVLVLKMGNCYVYSVIEGSAVEIDPLHIDTLLAYWQLIVSQANP